MAEELEKRRFADPVSPKQVVIQDPRGRPDSRAPHEYEELPGYSRYTPATYTNQHVQPLEQGLSNPALQHSGGNPALQHSGGNPALQHSGGSVSKGSRSSAEMQARSSNLSNGSATGSESAYRKRRNPLYDSLPRVDDMDDINDSGKHRGLSGCACVVLVLLTILVAVLLVLVVLLLGGIIGTKVAKEIPQTERMVAESRLVEVLKVLDELRANYSSLQETVTASRGQQARMQHDLDTKLLHTNLSSQEALQMNQRFQAEIDLLRSQLTAKDSTLSALRQNFSTFSGSFSAYQVRVKTQLDDTSKMPGPQGPIGPTGPQGEKGAGDLSGCRYRMKQLGTYVSDPKTTTSGIPDAESTNMVITGITCSTEGGTQANLVQVSQQYKCICTGAQTGASRRHCYMHIFECPKNS